MRRDGGSPFHVCIPLLHVAISPVGDTMHDYRSDGGGEGGGGFGFREDERGVFEEWEGRGEGGLPVRVCVPFPHVALQLPQGL